MLQATTHGFTLSPGTHLSTALDALLPQLQLPHFSIRLLRLLLRQRQLLLCCPCGCQRRAALLVCLLQLLPAVLQLLPAAVKLTLQLLRCWPSQAGACAGDLRVN